MFSWSKKKDSKRKDRPEKESEENDFGIKLNKDPDDKQLEAELKRLTGVDNFQEDDLNLNEGEEDVESELLRLIGGGKGKKPIKKVVSPDESTGDISELTSDIDLGDEDVEIDENDPELLGELLELTNSDTEIKEVKSDSKLQDEVSNEDSDIVITLKERIKLYEAAEAKAKENNESSRARRFARGIKTLENLMKDAKSGKAVSPSDIPPVIALNLKPAPQPEVPAAENETSGAPEDLLKELNSASDMQNCVLTSESGDIMSTLTERLKLYQTVEAKAKEDKESSRTRRFARGIKTIENLIKQAQAGNPVAPEDIPPEIALNLKPALPISSQSFDENGHVNYEEIVKDEMRSTSHTNSSDYSESNQKQKFNVMEVLSERLEMYKTAEAKTKESGEIARARRFTRAIKTLQDLIKRESEGKPIALDDIPPVIALNLKPALPLTIPKEEEPKKVFMDKEMLVKSSKATEKPLSFAAVDDVNIDEELDEEMATTVLEGLEKRAKLYKKFQEKALEEGNSDLADENEEIVGVYLNAIKTFQNGGYVDVEKLPNPNNYPPIPIPFFVP